MREYLWLILSAIIFGGLVAAAIIIVTTWWNAHAWDIRRERERHQSLGYDVQHDDRTGIRHLLYWAAVYIFHGKLVKGASLVVAARDVIRYRRIWKRR